MQMERIGNVLLWLGDSQKPGQAAFGNVPERSGELNEKQSEEVNCLREIIASYNEADYHEQITMHKNYTVMYQLAESRANIIEWLQFPKNARVLETGAGCGTITSALLKKAVHVTCQEEHTGYCRLNALRHKHVKEQTLTVYAMPFSECEPQLAKDYDVALASGIPDEKAKAQQFLEKLRAHLKPGGMLVLAVENKFGLKYWAGNKEMHVHRYFAGLENAGIHLYSKNSLKKLLTEAGFCWQDFYYPYPDHRFALDIYSDAYLPKKGDLTYNIANYEDDRLILFDEQKVFDSIIEEEQFPLFSNSYLCIAGTDKIAVEPVLMQAEARAAMQKQTCGSPEHEPAPGGILAEARAAMQKEACRSPEHEPAPGGMQAAHNSDRQHGRIRQQTVYVRYATDRSRQFAVRTDITDGMVRKCPVYEEGNAHVMHIAKAYARLTQQYEDTDLRFNRCRVHTDENGSAAAQFEFIHGEALQGYIERAIAADQMNQVTDVLDKMVQYIRNGRKNVPFQMTADFKKVFGEISGQSVLDQTVCSEVSDIDLILPNILVTEDGAWNVIDYEWTFFFPIPQNFIIYRTLFFLHHENPQRKELSMENLQMAAGISMEEAEVYRQMEAGFQQYVTGGLMPYREMVNLLGRRYFNIAELEAEYDRVMAENELLKGRIFWKAARKIKKKLTGN